LACLHHALVPLIAATHPRDSSFDKKQGNVLGNSGVDLCPTLRLQNHTKDQFDNNLELPGFGIDHEVGLHNEFHEHPKKALV